MKKIVSLILIITLFFTVLVGCGENDTTQNVNNTIKSYTTNGKTTKLVPDETATGELVIATNNFETPIVDPKTSDSVYKATKIFNELYPNVKVTTYRQDPNENYQEYQDKMNTQMMVGKGPDILMFSGKKLPSTQIDIYKMVKSGAIVDMYDFFENDKNFNISDYNKTVFTGSQFNGGQYVIPLTYEFPAMITSKSIADENGFNVKKCVDYESCIEEVGKLSQKHASNKEAILTFVLASDMLFYSGVPFIDYEKGTVSPDTPQIKELFEKQKNIFQIAHRILIWFKQVGVRTHVK